VRKKLRWWEEGGGRVRDFVSCSSDGDWGTTRAEERPSGASGPTLQTPLHSCSARGSLRGNGNCCGSIFHSCVPGLVGMKSIAAVMELRR
jgi:hypothetical protein